MNHAADKIRPNSKQGRRAVQAVTVTADTGIEGYATCSNVHLVPGGGISNQSPSRLFAAKLAEELAGLLDARIHFHSLRQCCPFRAKKPQELHGRPQRACREPGGHHKPER